MAESMAVLVVGDTHGNERWFLKEIVPYARYMGVSKLLQVGDFGFVWPGPNMDSTLSRINDALAEAELDLHFLPGNHEDHAALSSFAASAPVSSEGHAQLRSRIFYTGRVSAWEWNGRRCVAVGGATSIDRAHRVPGKSWWPEEALTPEESALAQTLGPADVLFTHDCPVHHPFKLLPDVASQAHREVITDVARALRPRAWFHGHYHQHRRYQFQHDGGECSVVGLDCDETPMLFSTAVLQLGGAPESSTAS